MIILDYKTEFKEHFRKLNLEWLEKYFTVEPHDIVQLSDPENEIINQGGLVYFASVDNKIVGTVALIKISESVYELCKMAVTEKCQGYGHGKKLLEHCIAKAKAIGANKLILFSSTKLIAAVRMYKNYGFKETELDESQYTRTSIKMELILSKE